MGLRSKKMLEEEEVVPAAGENAALALRFLSGSCGIAVSVVGIIGIFESAQVFDKKHWPVELKSAAVLMFFFEIWFGILILLAETSMPRCMVRLFGFLALRSGRGCFLILCAALQVSLGKAAIGTPALVVGITCFSVAVLLIAASLPCCPLPADPLSKYLLRDEGGGKSGKSSNGRGRGKHPEVAVDLETGAPKAAEDEDDNRKGRGRWTAFRSGPGSSKAGDAPPRSEEAMRVFGGGSNGGEATNEQSNSNAPSWSQASERAAPTTKPAASDNPFVGNRHLKPP